ncbi:MAG: hypothetical protein ACKOOI_18660 [Pirellula sp.]
MPRHISEERKTAYYVGMGLQILGGLLFASTFVTFLMHFGDFTNFEGRVKSDGFRAFGGMALLIIGGIIRGIGAKGLAGSGVLLDPERARDELEPYSRMAGGMVKDAIEEAKIDLGGEATKVIMVKCRSCGGLSLESAKFCQECGTKM